MVWHVFIASEIKNHSEVIYQFKFPGTIFKVTIPWKESEDLSSNDILILTNYMFGL